MLAALPVRSALGARKEANQIRRKGTGRSTTKRSFGIKLPSLLPTHGLVGRRTGIPLKQSVAQDNHNLDDVTHFWRDSLEGGAARSDALPAAEPLRARGYTLSRARCSRRSTPGA